MSMNKKHKITGLLLCLLLIAIFAGCSNAWVISILPDQRKSELPGPSGNIKFSAAAMTKTYGDNMFTNAIEPDYLGSGAVTYSSSDSGVALVNENNGEVTIQGAGQTVITAVKAADVTYAESTASYTLTVKKAVLSLMADNIAINRNAQYPSLTYHIEGFKYGEDLNSAGISGTPILNCGAADTSARGSYTITIGGNLSAQNYNFEFVDALLSIGMGDQVQLAMSDASITKTYGDPDFTLSTTGGSGTGLVHYRIMSGDDVISINGNTVTILKAGTASVEAIKRGDNQFRHSQSQPIPITVNKRDLSNASIDVGGTRSYTGQAYTPVPTVTDGHPSIITASDYIVNSESYSDNVNAGTATVTVTASENGNYTGSQTGYFTIDKAILTVSADNKNILYGDDAPDYTYTITGFINGESISEVSGSPLLSCTYTPGKSKGNYAINIEQSAPGGLYAVNYDFTFVSGVLSVGLADQDPLEIEDPGTKTYGDSNFTLSTTGGSGTGTVSYILVDGTDVIQLNSSTGEVFIIGNGEATVQAVKQGDSDHNSVTSDPLTITVQKRDLSQTTVTYSGTFTYNGRAQMPGPNVFDGGLISVSDWDVIKYSGNIGAGTATVTITASDNGNYTGTQTGTFTINKALLTVTADDKYIDNSESPPAYTYTVTGFVNSENISQVSGSPAFTCSYVLGGGNGDYDISISQGSLAADNYNFSFANGTLHVEGPALELYQPASLDFSMIEGFLSAQTITLRNQPPQATAAAVITSVTLTGTDSASFTLSNIDLGSVAVGGYTSFIITPQSGLLIANYSAVINVYYTYGTSGVGVKTFDLSLNVHSQFALPQTISTSVNTNELISAAGAVPGWYGREINGRWLTMGVMEHTVSKQIEVPIPSYSFNLKTAASADWTTVEGIARYKFSATGGQGSVTVQVYCEIYIPNDGYTVSITDASNKDIQLTSTGIQPFPSSSTGYGTVVFSGNNGTTYNLHINIQSNSTYTYLDQQPLPYPILEQGTFDAGAFTSSGVYYWRDQAGNDSFNFENASVSFLKFEPPELTSANHLQSGSIIIDVDPASADFIPDPNGTDYDYSGVTITYNPNYPVQQTTIGTHTVGVKLEAVGHTMSAANQGIISTVNLKVTYILDSVFSSNVASVLCNGQQATGPDGSGNYTVTLNGVSNGDVTLETVFNFTSQ